MTEFMNNEANIVLFGLDEELAQELRQGLVNVCGEMHSQSVPHGNDCLNMIKDSAVTLIFCGPDSELVSELRTSHPNASIVVVSRLPEVMDWLDAIEAGADDYCAPPFEAVQIRWILDANLRASRLAA